MLTAQKMLQPSRLTEALPDAASLPHSHLSRMVDGSRETIHYVDCPISFDCETYSFLVAGPEPDTREKRAVMWAWGMAIGEAACIGRTWEQFVKVIEGLSRKWHLNHYHRAIIYVHNLSYDFQFFRKWFAWENVFALSSREVCYAVTTSGVEFRCSYILTGYALEKVAEHLTTHTISKLVGSIDYELPRHPKTRLTSTEVRYLVHDCLIVTAHISEQIEREGGIANIPLTKTGYVRRDVKKACFRNEAVRAKDDYSRLRYRSYITNLWLDDFVYESLHRAFCGGFTHANPFHSGEIMEDVASYDFASAYPAVMVSELFPSTPPEEVTVHTTAEFEDLMANYCCVFTVHFKNLRSKFPYEHYLSSTHCTIAPGTKYQLDNGRVVWAEDLTTTITNVDWDIIKHAYTFDPSGDGAMEVYGMVRWGRSYLPPPIIRKVIEYFQAKTLLKGVPGKEQEYMSAKENLNSIYGMMVTNPLRPEIPYDLDTNMWGRQDGPRLLLEVPLKGDAVIKALSDYNEGRSRFLYYAWGVFVTAYCRRNLWRAIFHFGPDYVYSDTDSVKVLNASDPRHREHIEAHNKWIQERIKKCLKWSGMDPALSVASVGGKVKELGVWEYEGTYTRFKTLGAKRYMVETEGKYGGRRVNITVSGVNKHTAVPYIIARTAGPMRTEPEGGGDPFEFFQEGMEIPPGHAGKMIPYYGDTDIEGLVRDHDGRVYHYHERSYVHLEPGGYSLSLGPTYAKYLSLLMEGLI